MLTIELVQRNPWRVAAATLAVVAALAWYSWPAPPGTADIAAVREGPVTLTVPGRARLIPRISTTVVASESGTIQRIVKRAGERVVAGDTILIQSNPQLLADLARTRRERDTALADYESREAQIEAEDGKARLELSRARHVERVAEIQYRAEKTLNERGVSGAIAVEKAKADHEQKVAEREFAEIQLAERSRSGAADRKAALGKRLIAEAAAAEAQAKVEALTVRAPTDGVLGAMKSKAGASLAVGAEITEVNTVDLAIEIDVAEAAVVDVAVGQQVKIHARAFQLDAEVTSLEAVAENGLVIVRAETRQQIPAGVRANTTTEATIVTGQLSKALTVMRPPGAMPRSAGAVYVYDPSDRVARRTRVEFGPLAGNHIVIASGLKAGDQVALISSSLLTEPM